MLNRNNSTSMPTLLNSLYSFKKSFIFLAFLFILALFIGACSTQYLSNLEDKSDIAQTDINEEWITHIDIDNSFSIKYPSDWKVYQKSGLGYSFQSSDLLTGYGGEVKRGIYVRFTLWNNSADSINPKSPDDMSIGWFYKNFGNLEEGGLLTEPEQTELSGYPAIMAERYTFLLGKSFIVVVISEERSLIFDCFYAANNKSNAAEIFRRMLDTLQILS